MALSMIKSLKDTAGFVKSLLEYLGMKNKILFDSSTPWNSGTKTIKDISKYNLIQFDLDLGGVSGVAIRRSDTVFTGTANANYPSWMGAAAFLISLNGDSCTLDWGWVNITGGGTPSTSYGIKRIVGIEPIIPDALITLGGGYCVTWLGGGLRAVIKEVFDGYREVFCNIKQQLESWEHSNSVGIVNTKRCRRQQGESYRKISEIIFCNSGSIGRINSKHKLPRVISVWDKKHYKGTIYNGISQPIFKCSRFAGSVDRDRQGIVAPRGCCYV